MSAMKAVKGLLWRIPGIDAALCYMSAVSSKRRREMGLADAYGGGKTSNARYCYTVWMRHMVSAYPDGALPRVVAELGPGKSVGCGIAALLCGAEKYYGFEICVYTDMIDQLRILDELVSLLRSRAPIPDSSEFPNVAPKLSDYRFPSHILTDELLEKALAPERIEAIRRDLTETDNAKRVMLSYIAPWYEQGAGDSMCDYIFSQAVLEHIDALDDSYAAMARMLRPGGRMSHQIDLRSHSPSPYWNRQWGYGDGAWKRIRSVRPYYINREPLSAHIALLKKHGFTAYEIRKKDITGARSLPRGRLAPRFRDLSQEDLTTSGVFLLARNG